MPVDVAAEDDSARTNVAQRLVLRAIRSYQLLLAPMYSGSCRFLPSCSAYAFEAVERHGTLRGGWLALRRLMRCHPFGGHGHDPVPASAQSAFRHRGAPDSKTQ
jgi:putative membrane protein insertion efficiency factor